MSRLVVVKASDHAGLGDRLRALAAALGYAELSGRGVFVDWRDGLYAPMGVNSFPLLYRMRGPVPAVAFADWMTVAPEAWVGALDRTFSARVAERSEFDPWDRERAHQTYSIDLGRLDYPEQAVVIWDYEQLEKIAPALCARYQVSPETDLQTLLGLILRRHLEPMSEVLALSCPLADVPRGRPRLGLHVRHTHEGRDRQIPLDWCAAAIQLGSCLRPKAVSYLATDNRDVEAMLIAMGDVRTRTKWFPEPGLAMHLAEGGCPDPVLNGRMAAAELHSLSSCDVLIYPLASSFSTTAAAWSGLPSKALFPLVALGDIQGLHSRLRRAWAKVRFLMAVRRSLKSLER